MENLIIIVFIAVLLLVGLNSTRKHFKGKGGCCGGGGTYISKKKLAKVIAKKTVVIEGMTCENCQARVARVLNDIEGMAATVNLKKKEALVSMEKEISDEVIRAAIEKAGYNVVEIR